METNKQQELSLSYIDMLPLEIVSIIREYIPAKWRVWLNREGMQEQYVTVISAGVPGAAVRRLLRNDRAYPFRLIVKELYPRWSSLKRWQYKMWNFPTYVACLYHLCGEYSSSNCREVLVSHEKGLGTYRKNRSRKTRVRLNRWSS